MTISKRSLKNIGLLLLFEYNNFSYKKDLMDNIIYTSLSRDQNSHQWQSAVYWSHDTDRDI